MTLTEHENELFGSSPEFFYAHKEREFHIGATVLPLMNTTFESIRRAQFDAHQQGQRTDLDSVPMVLSVFGNPIMLPKMYDWLSDNISTESLAETETVMAEALQQLDASFSADTHKTGSPDFMSISIYRLRNEHPHLNFHTVGSCACWGVDPSGMFLGERDWDNKVAELTGHNVDSDQQLAVLFAGIGHMALRAKS